MDTLRLVTMEGDHSPGAHCRVLRVGDHRFYVELLNAGTNGSAQHWAVRFSKQGQYVIKQDVLALGISREQYEKCKARFAAWKEEFRRIQAQVHALTVQYEADAGKILGIAKPWGKQQG